MREAKKRDANLDLLRIVSMLLIVFLHSIDHSGVLEHVESCSGGMQIYVWVAYALCQVCVNCYVMLSGYYLVRSKFRVKKLVTLWMETVFYSFVLKLIFMLTGRDGISVVSLLSCFVPITTGRYWFITIYVGMYMVSPFLNKLICAMDRREHTMLNICLFLLFSLWSSIHPRIAGMNSGGGWGLAWFVVLYLAAAWFRLYYAPGHRTSCLLGLYLLIPLAMGAGQVAAQKLGIGFVQSVIRNWFRYDSAPVYLMTMAIFAAFLNLRIRNGRFASVICSIAPMTFGVYLIHAHADVSPWLWSVLDLPAYMEHAWFPVLQVACVVGIFAVCIVIDALRKATVGKMENASETKLICDAADTKLRKLLDALCSFIGE